MAWLEATSPEGCCPVLKGFYPTVHHTEHFVREIVGIEVLAIAYAETDDVFWRMISPKQPIPDRERPVIAVEVLRQHRMMNTMRRRRNDNPLEPRPLPVHFRMNHGLVDRIQYEPSENFFTTAIQ